MAVFFMGKKLLYAAVDASLAPSPRICHYSSQACRLMSWVQAVQNLMSYN